MYLNEMFSPKISCQYFLDGALWVEMIVYGAIM